MKYRHILLFLVAFLALLPSALRAQTNCSTITESLASTATTQPPACGTAASLGGVDYTVIWLFSGYCYNTQSGDQYGAYSTPLNGDGYCYWQPPNTAYTCAPTYTLTQTVPSGSSSTTYNQYTFQAWDGTPGAGVTSPPKGCSTINDDTTSAQCLTQACSTEGGGGGGGGCEIVTSRSSLTVTPEEIIGPQPCDPSDPSDPQGASPIVLDIDGNGFFLTNAENGVKFDISGSGHPIQMGWTAKGADNAFLALPGADGLIHNGKQLFGNFTPQPPSRTPNGFAALAVYDLPANGGNGDGVIDNRDGIFSSLRLWIDKNHDGVSQPDEIYTLPSLGINSISLKYTLDWKTDQYGNRFRYRARLNPDKPDEAGKIAYDIFFVTLDPKLTARLCALPIMVPGKH